MDDEREIKEYVLSACLDDHGMKVFHGREIEFLFEIFDWLIFNCMSTHLVLFYV